ncbi:MAG: Uma2 family endonuclease [Gemmatimonadales bacterium]
MACRGAVESIRGITSSRISWCFPISERIPASWGEVTDAWLAVEVSGRASRVYDRDFKRDAYPALGVREAWRIDLEDRTLEVVGRKGRAAFVTTDVHAWTPPGWDRRLTIRLAELFGGIDTTD